MGPFLEERYILGTFRKMRVCKQSNRGVKVEGKNIVLLMAGEWLGNATCVFFPNLNEVSSPH